ncbi:MAG: hypothetical protein ACRD5H_12640, partial [Nitrososphaerales archaeon]
MRTTEDLLWGTAIGASGSQPTATVAKRAAIGRVVWETRTPPGPKSLAKTERRRGVIFTARVVIKAGLSSAAWVLAQISKRSATTSTLEKAHVRATS